MSSSVRNAIAEDLPAVVAVHLASFPNFFLSELGPRFLGQFYAGLLEHPEGILIVATSENGVIGVVGGASHQVSIYADLLRKRKWQFALAAIPAVVRRPRSAMRVLRARRRAHGDDATPAAACLMTIGVDPATQGAGTGQKLVAAFEAAVRSAGADTYCLTTDARENVRTNRFYDRLGMTMTRVITTREGRHLNEYWKTVEAIEEDPA